MHLIDLILIIIIAAAVIAALHTYRKKGSCSCGGSCEHCAAGQMAGGCSHCKHNATQK